MEQLELQKLFPELQIRIAHGQMREKELENVMSDFYLKVPNINFLSLLLNRALISLVRTPLSLIVLTNLAYSITSNKRPCWSQPSPGLCLFITTSRRKNNQGCRETAGCHSVT